MPTNQHIPAKNKLRCAITLGNLLSDCLAFSRLFEGQFEGVDIPFTLFIVLRCVLNKNTACLWALREILFVTCDNGMQWQVRTS